MVVTHLAPTTGQVYLSRLLGTPILDAQGARMARVKDLVAHFGESPHPPVTGLVARGGRRSFYVSWSKVAGASERGIRLNTSTIDIRLFERRDGEVLLREDVLDKQLIDVDGHRVVRANDLLLAEDEGRYRLVGVDVSVQGLLRRLGPRDWTGSLASHALIDWADVESFATDVPMVRLRVSHDGVSKLHPVEIAQIVDALSQRQGQEILASLNDEQAADMVQELDPDDAADLLEGIAPERAADILDEMEPDDAADVLAEMEDEQTTELLRLMEPEEAEDVRELLAYADDTAAGLMTTDFIAVAPDLTVSQALRGIRAVPEPPSAINQIYLAAEEEAPGRQRLLGTLLLRDLVLAAPGEPINALADTAFRTVAPATPAREVAETMAEYNLLELAVVDEEGYVLGVVHIDDAVDVLFPDLWRRHGLGMFR